MAEISDPGISFSLFCNNCGICNHIFCGLTCFVCNTQLSKDSIIELRLGLPVTESILFVINALILQEPLQFLEEIYRSLTFRQEQMNLLSKRRIESYKDIEEGVHKREEHYQIEIKELQAICENLKNKNESLLSDISEKEKSLNELQQAYLEKSKQKESIENMYSALRSQISQSSSQPPTLLPLPTSSSYTTQVGDSYGRNGYIPLKNNNNSIIMNRSYSKVAPTPSRSFEMDNNNYNNGGRKFLRTNFSMVRPSTPSIQKHFGSFGGSNSTNGNMNQQQQQQKQQYRYN